MFVVYDVCAAAADVAGGGVSAGWDTDAVVARWRSARGLSVLAACSVHCLQRARAKRTHHDFRLVGVVVVVVVVAAVFVVGGVADAAVFAGAVVGVVAAAVAVYAPVVAAVSSWKGVEHTHHRHVDIPLLGLHHSMTGNHQCYRYLAAQG